MRRFIPLLLLAPCLLGADQPASDADLRDWLENMVWHHNYTIDEIAQATDLAPPIVKAHLKRLNISLTNRPTPKKTDTLTVMPYPGGRHPRIGFLDGAIDPERGTKISVFLPWPDSGYVVVDLPEAIFSNLGLTYLAHTHIPTIWTEQNIKLPHIDWTRNPDGTLEFQRTLPNKIAFGAKVWPRKDTVDMELWLKNGTDQKLTGLRTQICVMLKGAPDFNAQTNDNKMSDKPAVAVHSINKNRWIATAWSHAGRAWTNPPVPCLHSDPVFPDCPPGETKTVRGRLFFHDGPDINPEINRRRAAGELVPQ
jgi:hypothetical protein